MVEFVLDISRWQGNNPDLARAKAEGISGVIMKATQGSSWVDPMFATNLRRARAAGLVVAAYHYQENTPAAGQVANIKRVVPRDVPVCPDVESGSGSVGITREIVRLLRADGYTVPLSYIPRWYWQQIGSPSLGGLPPLWSSRYPDNVVNPYRVEYSQVPASYWDGYGGLPVALLQFTSSARVAGYSPLDCNAFRGTYQQLVTLFNGEDDDMPTPKEIAEAVWGYPLDQWDGPGDKKTTDRMHAGQQLNQARGFARAGYGRVGGRTRTIIDLVRKVLGKDESVDVAALADELAPRLNAASAKALSDEIARRMQS